MNFKIYSILHGQCLQEDNTMQDGKGHVSPVLKGYKWLYISIQQFEGVSSVLVSGGDKNKWLYTACISGNSLY